MHETTQDLTSTDEWLFKNNEMPSLESSITVQSSDACVESLLQQAWGLSVMRTDYWCPSKTVDPYSKKRHLWEPAKYYTMSVNKASLFTNKSYFI